MPETPYSINRHTNRSRPIFILGITQRSGTNFLFDLLLKHPACGAPAPIWEDFFTSQLDILDTYVRSVSGWWDKGWKVDDDSVLRIRRHLGAGIVNFLQEQTGGKRIVTKTPSVKNLQRFFDYFPNAHLLILVRDGRSVVESGIRSFNWHRDAAIHKWADAARTIESFDASQSAKPSRGECLVVRYEDLWLNMEAELDRILDFVDLPKDSYDFSAAAEMSVRGSSSIREQESQKIHWTPIAKTPSFDPMSRFSHWGRARHERFNWVAGKHLATFGYDQTRHPSAQSLWSFWNLLLDGGWLFVRTLGPTYLKWKRQVTARRSSAKTGSV